mmetsp:Transcript_3356/g.4940  ORF Transcript_3356/g.4940 Transcript_3356/m.4940 type:complete len:402 (+) Transcript_3356:79-1284(+)
MLAVELNINRETTLTLQLVLGGVGTVFVVNCFTFDIAFFLSILGSTVLDENFKIVTTIFLWFSLLVARLHSKGEDAKAGVVSVSALNNLGGGRHILDWFALTIRRGKHVDLVVTSFFSFVLNIVGTVTVVGYLWFNICRSLDFDEWLAVNDRLTILVLQVYLEVGWCVVESLAETVTLGVRLRGVWVWCNSKGEWRILDRLTFAGDGHSVLTRMGWGPTSRVGTILVVLDAVVVDWAVWTGHFDFKVKATESNLLAIFVAGNDGDWAVLVHLAWSLHTRTFCGRVAGDNCRLDVDILRHVLDRVSVKGDSDLVVASVIWSVLNIVGTITIVGDLGVNWAVWTSDCYLERRTTFWNLIAMLVAGSHSKLGWLGVDVLIRHKTRTFSSRVGSNHGWLHTHSER